MTNKEFRETFKIKETPEITVAEVEKKFWDGRNGEKLSKPYNMTFNTVEEWIQFQEHGPRQGWYVNKILEAPKGLDMTYVNPDPKNPQPAILHEKKRKSVA